MVVKNLNVECIAVLETETYAPLVVDADAPLSGAAMRQGLQSVGWSHNKQFVYFGQVLGGLRKSLSHFGGAGRAFGVSSFAQSSMKGVSVRRGG